MVDGPKPGALIAGRYRVERELGHGGMAVVLLAQDVVHERPVALKILRREMATAVSAERFLREIRLLSRLQHPHILPMFDSGMLGELPFFVMPYVEGETLRARMQRERQIALSDTLTIATDVLDAIQHAHDHDIVHRDIKPENILLASGRAYVADFGIARAIHRSADDPATTAGLAVGTPAYMSPEQASAEDELDGRSDIYAFGCVLFEMLAGIPPFVAATPHGAVSRRFVAPAPSVRELRENVPEHVEHAIARALARVPADRFASATEMRRALTEPAATTARTRVAPASRLRTQYLYAAAVAVLVAGALIATRNGFGIASPSVGELLTRGQTAILRWDPEEASSELRRAAAAAPSDPRVHLWQAQLGVLHHFIADTTWKVPARLAALHADSLGEHDRVRAHALAALADQRYPEACRLFDSLAVLRPGDPGALLGGGDCHALDETVLPASDSPSGWQFRSSYRAAAERYLKILERYPHAAGARPIVLGRLELVLRTDPNRSLRWGRRGGSVARQFGAHQAMLHDTLAFVPFPLEELDVGGRGMRADGVAAIAQRNRALLREVATSWAELAPSSADAHEALARALEATAEITSPREGAPSALSSVRRARQFSADPSQLLRVTHQHVRLLLRAGDFRAARALADTVLRGRWPIRYAADTELLSSIAALVGDAPRTARLLQSLAAELEVRLPDGRMYRPPPELASTALTLQAYAAVGARPDTINALRERLESRLESYVSAADRRAVRSALAGRALTLAVPLAGAHLVSGLDGDAHYIIRMQQMLLQGDTRAVGQSLQRLEDLRRDQAATDISTDATYLEAELYLAIGDTARARAHLNRMLNAVSALGPSFLDDAIGAGMFVRAMALRASLGRDEQDAAAAQWAAALRTLRPDSGSG